jgi:hypothetical protein
MSEIPKRAMERLQKAADTGFWGDLDFKFQAGQIILIRREEIERLQPNIKGNYDGQQKTGN